MDNTEPESCEGCGRELRHGTDDYALTLDDVFVCRGCMGEEEWAGKLPGGWYPGVAIESPNGCKLRNARLYELTN